MATRRASRKRSSGASLEMIAKWLFLVGLAVAVVVGIIISMALEVPGFNLIIAALMVVALITGFLFVRRENELHFFVMAIALFSFNSLPGDLPYVGQYASTILNVVSFYLGLASISVAVRSLISWYVPE